MKANLLLIEWGLLPKYFNLGTVLYLLLHVGLLVLVGLYYRSRVRAVAGITAKLALGVQPGHLDEMARATQEVEAARRFFIVLLLWEFVGSALLYAAGHSAGYW